MTVLKILGVLLAILSVVSLYSAIIIYSNKHTEKKFSYSFFSVPTVVIISISFILIYIGFEWYKSSLKDGGDTLNGIVIMVMGSIIYLGILIYNLIKTNVLYGIIGSIIQFCMLIPLIILGVYIFVIGIVLYLIFSFIANAGVTHVKVVK